MKGCQNNKEIEYRLSQKEMVGSGLWKIFYRTGGKILAFVTWKINRFGYKNHNNKELNKKYFAEHSADIELINDFLEDDYSKEIYAKIWRYRMTHKIKYQPDYNKKNQYFPRDIITIRNNEVFIDCGAYTGDTIKMFKEYSGGQYRKIIAFEPSCKNGRLINEVDNRIIVINKGVWDENCEVSFQEDGEGSVITDKGSEKISCCRIDDCEECRDATFIKMDVEGSELRALKGCKNIISQNHPTLAICLYHNPEDMVEIPMYLKEQYPFYKFYVRHHSHRCAETVLYAVEKST